LTFEEAQHRAVAKIRDLIHRGEWTERGFARWIGVSQPHIHNVLKGQRKLSRNLLDQILRSLHCSIADLCTKTELEHALARKRMAAPRSELPFLTAPIGPGMPWTGCSNPVDTFPVPAALFSSEAVVARLATDSPMRKTLAGADVAAIDLTPEVRREPVPEGLYVVSRKSEALLRFVRPGQGRFYLPTDDSLDRPALWEALELDGRSHLDIIQGRVTWLGREADRNAPDQRGRILSDATSR
jgi:plasmid maintenance system antidote protein VapI